MVQSIHPSLQEKKFWDILEFLTRLDKKQEVKFILDTVGIEIAMLDKALAFLQEMNVKFSKETFGDREFLVPSGKHHKIKFEFDLVDWLKFQAHFPLLSSLKDQPFHQKVAENLGRIEDRYKNFDLFRAVKVLGHFGKNLIPTLVEAEPEIMPEIELRTTIEQAIEHKHSMKLRLHDHQDMLLVYPHRLVHLDGALSVVAEEINEKTLIYLELDKIDSVMETDNSYEALHSIHEIDDFISGIRAVNGNEVRLVLKIINPNDAQELAPLYHFLRKPYVISNPRGDLIWAASIEENEDIYEWLSTLSTKVEILDPTSFKMNYLAYCEKKLKNIA